MFPIVPWRSLLAVAAMGVLAGCGPGNPLGRKAISGRITLDGAPLEQGNIRFEPLDGKSGIASGAVIEDGRFAMAKLKGLPPGKYRVRIFSSEPAPQVPGPEGELPAPGADLPGRSLIPPEYNTASQIVHEVTADGGERFELDVQTK